MKFASKAFLFCWLFPSLAWSIKPADLRHPHIPGEVLVKLKKTDGAFNKAYSHLVDEHFNLSFGSYAVLKFDSKADLVETINSLNNNPEVEYAEPNYLYFTNTSDPKFDQLWGLDNRLRPSVDINALRAWDVSKGSRNIKIAVIDTGLDYRHEDLRNNVWTNTAELNGKPGKDDDQNGYIDDVYGYDFANNDNDPLDGNGHGTHCAGTIAAEHDNGVGVAGVMAQAQLIGVKFLKDNGSGSTSSAIKAIDYAARLDVDIMSNSWGSEAYSQALKEAIERTAAKGIIFVAAAGNSNTNNDTQPHYPASYKVDNIISVAAHNNKDQLASFSCYGANSVHVAAPGQDILSTTPNNRYDSYSGTSMATPHVSGVIGLYLSHHGKTDVSTVKKDLIQSSIYAAAYGRKTISGGRVDAYEFLNQSTMPRPAKPEPNAWRRQTVTRFESKHPYRNQADYQKTYRVSGAKFVRVLLSKFDLEKDYDYISILDQSGNSIQRIDGKGRNKQSEYVEGDEITVRFESDSSLANWGFLIDEIEYIK